MAMKSRPQASPKSSCVILESGLNHKESGVVYLLEAALFFFHSSPHPLQLLSHTYLHPFVHTYLKLVLASRSPFPC